MSDDINKLVDVSQSNLDANEAIRDTTSETGGIASAATIEGPTEITVNVEGTSTVTVTGFDAGVSAIAAGLATAFGGFTTEADALRIANEVLENIRTELLRRGIITANTL